MRYATRFLMRLKLSISMRLRFVESFTVRDIVVLEYCLAGAAAGVLRGAARVPGRAAQSAELPPSAVRRVSVISCFPAEAGLRSSSAGDLRSPYTHCCDSASPSAQALASPPRYNVLHMFCFWTA